MANKAVVRRWVEEVMNQGRLDVLDELCTPEMAVATREWVTPFLASVQLGHLLNGGSVEPEQRGGVVPHPGDHLTGRLIDGPRSLRSDATPPPVVGEPRAGGRVRGVVAAQIRLARQDELSGLRDIERAAGEVFRTIGMDQIADDEPLSLAEFAHYQRSGRAWVATDGGPPVAYLLAEPVDGDLHIAQVSVHPVAAGRGLGRALIEHLVGVPAAEHAAGLSLTTYTEVPWNGPYYRRLEFTELPEAQLGPGLRAIRELERKAGLDRWPRAAFHRSFQLAQPEMLGRSGCRPVG